MDASSLASLASEEFFDRVGTHSSAESLRRYLKRSPRVRELTSSLGKGELTEDDIRHFVSKLLSEFRTGEAFAFEITLAAIAVSLESRNSPFVEEYLIDLARTKVAELAMCRRVAALSAKAWASLPKFKVIKDSRPKFGNRFSNHLTAKVRGSGAGKSWPRPDGGFRAE
jgi:hypothetical protein